MHRNSTISCFSIFEESSSSMALKKFIFVFKTLMALFTRNFNFFPCSVSMQWPSLTKYLSTLLIMLQWSALCIKIMVSTLKSSWILYLESIDMHMFCSMMVCLRSKGSYLMSTYNFYCMMHKSSFTAELEGASYWDFHRFRLCRNQGTSFTVITRHVYH